VRGGILLNDLGKRACGRGFFRGPGRSLGMASEGWGVETENGTRKCQTGVREGVRGVSFVRAKVA